METQQKVLLYGDSLVLAGMQASLKACPWLEVITLDGTATEEELHHVNPGVVIFDMGGAQSEILLTQMQAQPDLLLIGIDPESHEVLLTGGAARTITLDQITQILRSREPDPPRSSSGDAESKLSGRYHLAERILLNTTIGDHIEKDRPTS